MECKFIYCSKCAIKISINFLQRRRFCLDCIKLAADSPREAGGSLIEETTQYQEELKVEEVSTHSRDDSDTSAKPRVRLEAPKTRSTFMVDSGVTDVLAQQVVSAR
jgi:hypothetical protein